MCWRLTATWMKLEDIMLSKKETDTEVHVLHESMCMECPGGRGDDGSVVHGFLLG